MMAKADPATKRQPAAEKLPANVEHAAPTEWALASRNLSGNTTRKGKNLASKSDCAVTVATDEVHLVVEREAAKVSDDAKLQRVAAAYASKYEWQVTVRDGAFDAGYGAPTADPPPYEVYELTPRVVFGFGLNETFSPTRWQF